MANQSINYNAPLGLPDKGRAIKGLVVFYCIAKIIDLKDRLMDERKVRGLVPC